MGFNDHVYVLESPDSGQESAYGDPAWSSRFRPVEVLNDYEGIKCPVNPEHQRAGRRIGALEVVFRGQLRSDFLWTWHSQPMLIERAVSVFEKSDLTGYRLDPVTIFSNRSKREVRDDIRLFELVAIGKPVPTDPLSGVRELFSCESCGLRKYSSYTNGLLLREEEWDGSDVFTVREYWKHIIVSERARSVIEEAALTNCALVRTRDVSWGKTVRPEDVYRRREKKSPRA
ncbi:MAG: hypothetical protein IMZ71_03820 [Chloroflexi bacterium]|nr:hypothetical protein [Chloroflexota bacterium]